MNYNKMDKHGLMGAMELLKYEMVQKLMRYVRDNGTAVTDYERNEFGLDCDEDDGHTVTEVLNLFDNGGCHFFEPDKVNDDRLDGQTGENFYDLQFECTVHTAYQCLYIVADEDDNEELHYYRFTNGGLTWDDDQAEPDHGNCHDLTLIDLHYLLEAININF